MNRNIEPNIETQYWNLILNPILNQILNPNIELNIEHNIEYNITHNIEHNIGGWAVPHSDSLIDPKIIETQKMFGSKMFSESISDLPNL